MSNGTPGRKWARRLAVAGVLGLGLGVCAERLVGQQPGGRSAPVAPPATPAPTIERDRPVAYLNGTTPVTQEEFGRYLMDRGGYDRLESFVNKRIIEIEAERRKVTVTKAEMEVALAEDLEGMTVSHNDFVKVVLPKYGRTLYEWMEDVIRPRLLLAKMCRDQVKVSDDGLKKQYERMHGEKRVLQMIIWPSTDDGNTISKIRGKIAADPVEFDSVARSQPNPLLGASKGVIKPISRHLPGEDKRIEDVAFQLKVNEVSEVMATKQGYVVIKLNEVIPPNDRVTFETEKPKLFKAAFEEQLTVEIPKFFATLKEAAKPTILYSEPTDWKTVTPAAQGSITVPGSGGAPPSVGIQPASGTTKK